jgi:hypothetical protein
MGLGSKGWKELQSWSVENNPRYGMEMDLVSRMTSPKFYPSPKQTKILYRILKESIDLGFKQ